MDTLKYSDITVIKRNGKEENFKPEKIHQHLEAACKGISGVYPGEILSNVHLKLTRKMKSKDIQNILINSTVELISEQTPNYDKVAARLLNQDIRKRVYGQYTPIFDVQTIKNRIKRKMYDPQLLEYYTDQELEELISVIKFERDDLFTYLGLAHTTQKYCISRNGRLMETPQEIFFLIPLYAFMYEEKNIRKKLVKKYYNALSTFKLILSTPPMNGLRTTMRGYTSCCGFNVGDSIESIGNTAKDMFAMITKLRAGVGLNSGFIRGVGADINNGMEEHTGLVPYLKVYERISKSSMQPNSGRSGAVTNYYPFFHWEIQNILQFKNNKGTEETRVRYSDHAIVFNELFYERYENGEDITLFHMNDVGNLYEIIGRKEEFKKKYIELENDPKIKKVKVPAKTIYDTFWNERFSHGRNYKINAENMDEHSAFKLPVYTSNLCLDGDTVIDTKNGPKKLKDVKEGDYVLSYNLESQTKEYKRVLRSFMTSPMAHVIKISDPFDSQKFIICTLDHQIYTKNRGYVQAKDIKPDDILLYNGAEYKGCKIDGFVKSRPVYDIEVQDNHNFFANDILVHNCTEIALPSYPNEKLYFDLKSSSTQQEVNEKIEKLYKEGKWYNLYSHLQFNTPLDKEIDEYLGGVKRNKYGKYHYNFGETFACILGGINVGAISNLDELEELMYLQVRFLDNMIDIQDYAGVWSFEKAAKKRRALGISPSNFFYYLAKKGADYDSREAYQVTAELMENMLYYGLKASVELAKERGACEYFKDTKYSDGLLPIDTYNKKVDTLVKRSFISKEKWDKLREDIKKYGLRNSTILTVVPASNSSRVSNSISGVNPPQSLIYTVEDKKVSLKGALPGLNKYKNFYIKNSAWNIDTRKYFKLLSVIQKYVDQAMSINTYFDFIDVYPDGVPEEVVIEMDYISKEFGLKSIYYSKTRSKEKIDEQEIKEESNCSGGGCTL